MGEPLLTNAKIRGFWSLVDIRSDKECWIWRGNIAPSGYGRFRVGDQKVGAHRIALILEGPPEPAPPNNHALHGDCSDRRCVNPAHLRWGNNHENIGDMLRLDRHARGSDYKSARLTEEQVRYIRNSGATGKAVADQLGVSTALVSLVRNRKVWTHVD